MHISGMNATRTLADRIREGEFHPEVYLYPTPRMYRPLENFSLQDAEFTEEANLYVHIPFCKQLCSYCGYLKTIDEERLRRDYVDTIVKEIGLRKEALKGRIIKTLHFGGGTPSLLSSRDLEKIVKALEKVNPEILTTSQEVSIEATPESVDATKFDEYRRTGINRVSLGVQSFNCSEIAISKRCNLPEISIRAIETLREISIQHVVIDLMIGIEGQNAAAFQDSIRGALHVRPETIQLYALGLMPQTGLGIRNPLTLMTNEQIYQCYEVGRSLFLEAGYRQDCHDRYAIPGRGGFLQGDYVLQGMSLIGFGAGARSYAKNLHYRNTYDSFNGRRAIEEYMRNIEGGPHSVQSGVFLDDDEVMRQYAIGTIESLDRDNFHHRFGILFEEKFSQLYADMREWKLVEEDGSILRMTPRGLLYRDLIAKQLFSAEALKVEEAYRPGRRQ
jgi:oxygen-independent coproporphyrinogen III oxidase